MRSHRANLFDRGPGDRRDFFRASVGDWMDRVMAATEERIAPDQYVRPPGALPEVAFLAACTRCGDCLPVCPVGAIVKVPASGGLAAGTPRIDPRVQPCIACTDMPCVRACPTGALTAPARGWTGYRLARMTFVPERCVTFRGTPCRACADACPIGPQALAMDAAGHPVLKAEGCVGCAVCERACIASPPAFEHSLVERT